eukprot:3136842-Ditylum_brightwellii.AAC.1
MANGMIRSVNGQIKPKITTRGLELHDKPAFKWWVPHVIRKRNQIINKVKFKYWRISHKFGIRLPKTVDKALQIDMETGTDHWRCTINKEVARVKVAWIAREDCNPDDVRTGK